VPRGHERIDRIDPTEHPPQLLGEGAAALAQLLRAGAPALWLTCGAVAGAAALGQLALAPALRRRTRPHHSPATPSPPATPARAQTTGADPTAGR